MAKKAAKRTTAKATKPKRKAISSKAPIKTKSGIKPNKARKGAKSVKLTPNQELFALGYMETNNATQAYLKVYGCSLKAAEAGASRTLRIDKVEKYIQKMKDKVAKKVEISIASVVEDIKDTHRRAKEAKDEKGTELKASDMLLKHLGGYEKDNEQSNAIQVIINK